MPQKLSPEQFAQQIKAKYPQYANVDNATLTQKMLEKYPQYADRVETGAAAPQPQPTPPQGVLNKLKQVPGQAVEAGKALFKFLTTSERAVGEDIAGAILPYTKDYKQAVAAGAKPEDINPSLKK